MSAVRPLLILAATIALAAAVFVVVDARTDDVSGATPGIAATAVIGVGIVVLMLVQRGAVSRARRDAATEAARPARIAGTAVTDPGRLEPAALVAALAIRPVDERELVAASDAAWGLAERSQRSATTITILIVVLMVPALALQQPRLIVLGAIPIVGYALVLAGRVLRPGGTLDQAWAASDARLAPLGLRGEERPDVVFVPRLAGDGLQSDLVGPTVLRGERHGRAVQVTIGGGRAETHVACSSTEYALRGYHQRVRADGNPQPPPPVRALLDELGPSSRWTGMRLRAGPDGITVTRRGTGEAWLYDLWLSERLASATS